ncbi:hypothetical protein BJY04DRAFT_223338 [Aspergillus karnatakaensis]|uniref:uncharacterized protein n=1 Tax=Aspergillus karnatakaensis TaxID=1810916 RepID=UPI003CCCB890
MTDNREHTAPPTKRKPPKLRQTHKALEHPTQHDDDINPSDLHPMPQEPDTVAHSNGNNDEYEDDYQDVAEDKLDDGQSKGRPAIQPVEEENPPDTEISVGDSPEREPSKSPRVHRKRTITLSRDHDSSPEIWRRGPRPRETRQVSEIVQEAPGKAVGTVGDATTTLRNTAGSVLGSAVSTQERTQGDTRPRKEEQLRLRLDLNLDLEVQLKAKIHGDLTLQLFDGLREMIPATLRMLDLTTGNNSEAFSTAYSTLWKALEDLRIPLSSVSVAGTQQAIPDLLSYLTSYTGLKSLRLPSVLMSDERQENDAGNRFWRDVIPNHHATLEELHIEPIYEGSWCYGPPAAEALQVCHALQKLTISMRYPDLSWQQEQWNATQASGVTFEGWRFSTTDRPPTLFASFISTLSVPLAEVCLITAKSPTERGRESNKFQTQQDSPLVQNMQAQLLRIQAPDSVGVKWPWKVIVGDWEMQKERLEEDGRLDQDGLNGIR